MAFSSRHTSTMRAPDRWSIPTDPITAILDWPDPLSNEAHPGVTRILREAGERSPQNIHFLPSSSTSSTTSGEKSSGSSSSSATDNTSTSMTPSKNLLLPETYSDLEEYRRYICPLLLEEAREEARGEMPSAGVAPLLLSYDGHYVVDSSSSNSSSIATSSITTSTSGSTHQLNINSAFQTHGAFNRPSSSSISSLSSSSSSSQSASPSSSSSETVTLMFNYHKMRQYEWEDGMRDAGLLPGGVQGGKRKWSNFPNGNKILVLLSPDSRVLDYRKKKPQQQPQQQQHNRRIPPCIVAICTKDMGDANANGARFEFVADRHHFTQMILRWEEAQLEAAEQEEIRAELAAKKAQMQSGGGGSEMAGSKTTTGVTSATSIAAAARKRVRLGTDLDHVNPSAAADTSKSPAPRSMDLGSSSTAEVAINDESPPLLEVLAHDAPKEITSVSSVAHVGAASGSASSTTSGAIVRPPTKKRKRKLKSAFAGLGDEEEEDLDEGDRKAPELVEVQDVHGPSHAEKKGSTADVSIGRREETHAVRESSGFNNIASSSGSLKISHQAAIMHPPPSHAAATTSTHSSSGAPISTGCKPVSDIFAQEEDENRIPDAWYCWTMSGLTTQLRELEAVLTGLQDLDSILLQTLLQPGGASSSDSISAAGDTSSNNNDTVAGSKKAPIPSSRPSSTRVPREKYLSQEYRNLYLAREFNDSQREAIEAALVGDTVGGNSGSFSTATTSSTGIMREGTLNNTGFTLIQGPPGTGKTTTIIGLVNSLHLAAYGYYFDTLLGFVPLPPQLDRGKRVAVSASTHSTTTSITALSSSSSSSAGTGVAKPTSNAVVPGVVVAVPLHSHNATSSTVSTPTIHHKSTGALTLAALFKATEKEALERQGTTGGQPLGLSSSSTTTSSSLVSATTHPAADASAYAGYGHGCLRYLLTSTTPIEICLQALQAAYRLKPRILITAPANTAVDGILLRIVHEQLRSGALSAAPPPPLAHHQQTHTHAAQLSRYCPPIRRVGEGASAEVKALPGGVYLEGEIDRLMSLIASDDQAVPVTTSLDTGGLSRTSKLTDWIKKLEKDHFAILADLTQQRASVQSHPAFIAWREKQYQQQQQQQLQAAVKSGIQASSPSPSPSTSLSISYAEEEAIVISLLHRISSKVTRAAEAYERNRMKLQQARCLQNLAATGAKSDQRGYYSNRNDVKRALRNLLLEDAQIVLTTTSSAALSVLESFTNDTNHTFPICIIDEAAQAVEPSTLIPLRYHAKQVVLVGDPQQLPATITSRVVAKIGYDRSLFARMADAGHPVHMLRVQYRCHPQISAFPSHHFYAGKLLDGENVRSGSRSDPIHSLPCFNPLVFYDSQVAAMDVIGGGNDMNSLLHTLKRNAAANAFASSAMAAATTTMLDANTGGDAATLGGLGGGGGFGSSNGEGGAMMSALSATGGSGAKAASTGPSYRNFGEVLFIMRILEALHHWRGTDPKSGQKIKFSGNVGVITFYRAQVSQLQYEFAQRFTNAHQMAAAAAAAPSSSSSEQQQQQHDTRIPLRFTVDINTVDGFQGQERDIIILSCVRTEELATNARSAPFSPYRQLHHQQAFPPVVAPVSTLPPRTPPLPTEASTISTMTELIDDNNKVVRSVVDAPPTTHHHSNDDAPAMEEGEKKGDDDEKTNSVVVHESGSATNIVSGADAAEEGEVGILPTNVPAGTTLVVDDLRRETLVHSSIEGREITRGESSSSSWSKSGNVLTTHGDFTSSSTSATDASDNRLPSTAVSLLNRSIIGFLDDPRRINVALTRARYSCWVVGQASALLTSTHWAAFVHHCMKQGKVIQLSSEEHVRSTPITAFTFAELELVL